MKQEKKINFSKANLKIVITVIPIVLVMIIIFFILTRNEILALSMDKLSLQSRNIANEAERWAGQVLDELEIFRIVAEQSGLENENTFEIISSSCGISSEYPYGLYWGNSDCEYFDSSGWVPGEDFVVVERNWYIEGLKHENFAFGQPYVDVMTGDVCVSATVRLDYGSKISVLAADVYLDYAAQLVWEMAKNNVDNAFFVTADTRTILADSDSDMVGALLGSEGQSELLHKINVLLNQNKIGRSEVEGDGIRYLVDISKIDNTNWYFVTSVSQDKVLDDLKRVEAAMLVVAFLAAGVLIFVTFRLSKEMSKIRTAARTDPLTRLYNRDGFREMSISAMEARPGQGILLIIDMDNFKLVNDQLGHPAGDAVLKRFSNMLENYFNRNKDITARIGGDEFAVFVGRDISALEADAMLKKFLNVFHRAFDEEYPEQKLSVSVGASFVSESEKFDQLYKNADNALYEVKRDGKDGFKIL